MVALQGEWSRPHRNKGFPFHQTGAFQPACNDMERQEASFAPFSNPNWQNYSEGPPILS